MSISLQVLSLLIIAMPIASVAWTVTPEEVFREFHDLCLAESRACRRLYQRKFFYLFTCEYCISHSVTALFLVMLFPDWRGYLIAGFSLVWIANGYLVLFARLRLDVKRERVEITAEETMSHEKHATGKPMQFPATQSQIRGATKGQV
jgi:hypothetical protein